MTRSALKDRRTWTTLAYLILMLPLGMHLARGVGRLHAMYAKALLVAPAAKSAAG